MCYPTAVQNIKKNEVYRFYTPKVKAVWEALGGRPLDQTIVVEHVYFDTGHPTLFYTGFVRGRRLVNSDDPLFDSEALYFLEFRLSSDHEIQVHPEAVPLEQAGSIAREVFDVGDVVPLFGLRFERQTGRAKGVRVDVDHDTTYFSLMGDEPFEVGREETPRMSVRRETEELTEEALESLLNEMGRAPCTAKKWMGFNFIKTCYELPRVDELAGYEYELKLDVDSLDLDFGLLPFPVLEVYQSDSLRRYYKKYRACLRGDSAHLVEKGPVQSIGGVLKRREVKKRGLMAWDLPEPKMVMHRYKREVNILNPDTGRVYTLSLHHCEAGETFQQVEIEYDGRLVPRAVTTMAKFRAQHRPEFFLEMGSRADAAGWGELGDSLREKYVMYAGDDADLEMVQSCMSKNSKGPDEGEDVDPRVEEEVVDDMLILRNALLRQGMRPSRITKRKWLRRVYADRND